MSSPFFVFTGHMQSSFYNLTYQDLYGILSSEGLNTSAASLLYNWHYKKKRVTPCEENISKPTLGLIRERFHFDLPEVDTVYEAQDRTVKFLFKLKDGSKVETVLIPFNGKYSVCLSSQVGCAMNCSFCFTGKQGFKRNLETSEITGQFLQAWRWLSDNRPGEERVLNIVFMGQGEPLHNFDSVKKACEIFLSQHGASVAAQKITVSTSGYLPGLKRWKDEMPQVNLALSLHSPYTEKRNELIPINRAYPVEDVLALIDDLPLAKKQFVTYEYLLIDGFNDGAEDARKTGELLKRRRALLNLIPFNPIPGSPYRRPSNERVEAFKQVLEGYGTPVLVRETKGDDVMAACGQLNSSGQKSDHEIDQ